jgi:hypothetical protein
MCDIVDKLELVLHCYRLMQQGNGMAEEVFLRGVNYLNKKYKKELIFKPASEIIKILCDDI